ncbi:MAG TPA: hypothetical protein VHL98_13865 [Microvirga sp.]|jgi:hypothetical protein|nr:hypothetical protein [Microvirga sp.]
MNFDWKAEGFAAAPVLTTATGTERLYRAWGGTSTQLGNPKGKGVCFSFDRARTRAEAELLYAVMEWNNGVMRLTEFSVPKGLPLWVGRVDPGDRRAALGHASGSQVFVERGYVKSVIPGATTTLTNDLGPNQFVVNAALNTANH